MSQSTEASKTTDASRADAAIARINQLTEQIVAAARSAGSGFLEAYEKALQSLADFRPRDTATDQLEWVQAIADTHATFIAEVSTAYVTAAHGSTEPTPTILVDQATVDRIRRLNEQIVTSARSAGSDVLDGYEKALKDLAEFETKVTGATHLDWVQAIATAHTQFITGLGSTYVNAARAILR
jgi:hypothetical protein